jgi:HK97 family phage major capsid protein
LKIAETAQNEDDRDLTPSEKVEFDRLSREALEKKSESDKAKAGLSRMNEVRALTSAEDDEARAAGKTLASRLPLPADLAAGDMRSLHDAVTHGMSYRVKATAMTEGDWSAPPSVDNPPVGGDYLTGRRLAQLFGTRQAPGPVVRVYRTNAKASAAVVGEGEEKPDSGLTVESVDVSMRKIAVVQRVTDELSRDFSNFRAFVSSELQRAVLEKENDTLRGDLLDAGLDTMTSSDDLGADAVADAIAELQGDGISPDALVMAPSRLASIRKSKTDDGSFLVTAPASGTGPAGLWGLPIIVQPNLVDTTVLVGSFRNAGTIYVRDPLTVDADRDSDDFTHNRQTIRAEERLALAVTSPQRILNVTLGSSNG